MILFRRDIECLEAAEARDQSAWLPWRGVWGRAKRLTRDGLLLEAGIAAMPPHTLYVLSDAGRAALSEYRAALSPASHQREGAPIITRGISENGVG